MSTMHLAIVHYHLNRGGVTQVIQNHLRALAASTWANEIEQVLLLYGGRRHDWPAQVFASDPPFDLRLVEVPLLEYDSSPVAMPDELAVELRCALADTTASANDTLLHVHNHALGKNASLPGALTQLRSEGYRQLLQIHDFVEDLRPENYRHLAEALGCRDNAQLAAQLYPQGPGFHYAVLNDRDHRVLTEAGLSARRLHKLPNPVAEFDKLPDQATARRVVDRRLGLRDGRPLVVYPVRGIRRKNIGEMILLSVLDPLGASYAVTLAPLNPNELGSFREWQGLAELLALSCRFDIGSTGGVSFHDALAAADALVSTSVAEGFGMVFLEAWLAGRVLVGRNLPEITADFTHAGLNLDSLYDRLAIPLHLIDETAFRQHLLATYLSVSIAYGQPQLPDSQLDAQVDELIRDSTVDFAFLSSQCQRQLITRASRDAKLGDEILAANPRLAVDPRVDSLAVQDTIRRNADVVRDRYSLEAAGERLVDVYRSVFNDTCHDQPTPLPHGDEILGRFLDVRRLHPLRVTTAEDLAACRRSPTSSED